MGHPVSGGGFGTSGCGGLQVGSGLTTGSSGGFKDRMAADFTGCGRFYILQLRWVLGVD